MAPQQEGTENGDDDHIEWHATPSGISFGTRIEADSDVQQADIEEQATEELLEAIKRGDATVRWNFTSTTPEQRRRSAEMDEALRCDHCDRVTEREKREVVVDDAIQLVCPSCGDALRNTCNRCGRHRDDLDSEEAMTVLGTGPVVEYVCTDCESEADGLRVS